MAGSAAYHFRLYEPELSMIGAAPPSVDGEGVGPDIQVEKARSIARGCCGTEGATGLAGAAEVVTVGEGIGCGEGAGLPEGVSLPGGSRGSVEVLVASGIGFGPIASAGLGPSPNVRIAHTPTPTRRLRTPPLAGMPPSLLSRGIGTVSPRVDAARKMTVPAASLPPDGRTVRDIRCV
jgi:hypothetical protein